MVEAEEKKAADEKAAEGESKVAKETPEVKTFMTTYFEFPGTFTTNLMNSRKFLQVGLGVSTQYDDKVMEMSRRINWGFVRKSEYDKRVF